MFYGAEFAVYSEINTKHVNTEGGTLSVFKF